MRVTFFNQIILGFYSRAIIVQFSSQASDYGVLSTQISCTASERQIHLLSRSAPHPCLPFPRLEDLCIFEGRGNPSRSQDDVENTLWLELLHPFAAVMKLCLCDNLCPYCARPSGTCWGKNDSDRRFAHPGEYFLGWFSAVVTPPWGHRRVLCRTTAHWHSPALSAHQSPCSSFSLGYREAFYVL